MNPIIEQAIEKIQPIVYNPAYPAHFVRMNDIDMSGEDYCLVCIAQALIDARKAHKEKRQTILDKFKEIEETGHYKHNGKRINVKAKYSDQEISKAKTLELKEYPAKVKFTSSHHDPDFGGGLHEPCSCEKCGEPFECEFTPDRQEAEYVLNCVKNKKPLSDREKWEIDIALNHFEYTSDSVKEILLKAANFIIKL